MKALEHLLIQEVQQIRSKESKLQRHYQTLSEASEEQVAAFLAGLADLERQATRVEALLDAIAMPEPIAA